MAAAMMDAATSMAFLSPAHQPARVLLSPDGRQLTYTYDTQGERTGITALLDDLGRVGIGFSDLQTTQSSLEDIFVNLVKAS
jgi:ABC-2 type transport system ATP-binding protein